MTASSTDSQPDPHSVQTKRFIDEQLQLISEPFRPNLKRITTSIKGNGEHNDDTLLEPTSKQMDMAVKKINAVLRNRINAFFEPNKKNRVLTEIADIHGRRQTGPVPSEEISIPREPFSGSTFVGTEPLAEEIKRSGWLDAYPIEWTSKTGESEPETKTGTQPDVTEKDVEMIREYENVRRRCQILEKTLATAIQLRAQYESLRDSLSETSTLAIRANTTEAGSELSKELKRTAVLLPKVIDIVRQIQENPKKRNREDTDLEDDHAARTAEKIA